VNPSDDLTCYNYRYYSQDYIYHGASWPRNSSKLVRMQLSGFDGLRSDDGSSWLKLGVAYPTQYKFSEDVLLLFKPLSSAGHSFIVLGTLNLPLSLSNKNLAPLTKANMMQKLFTVAFLMSAHRVSARQFTVKNNCKYTVWYVYRPQSTSKNDIDWVSSGQR
jgi:hypothetical protein